MKPSTNANHRGTLRRGTQRGSISNFSGIGKSTLNFSPTAYTSATSDVFHRVIIDDDNGGGELQKNVGTLSYLLLLRDKYKGIDKGQKDAPLPSAGLEGSVDDDSAPNLLNIATEPFHVDMEDITQKNGVFEWPGMQTKIPTLENYVIDYEAVCFGTEDASVKTTCRHRLHVLEEKYHLYSLLNHDMEEAACPWRKGGGVYAHNMKVDNNVGLSTLPTADHLLQEIRRICNTHPDEYVVKNERGEKVSLKDMLTYLGISDIQDLTPEGLGVVPTTHEHLQRLDSIHSLAHATFDHPSQLLRAFMERNPVNEGKFFAEIVKPLLDRAEVSAATRSFVLGAEVRLPIYGASRDEWSQLAKWLKEKGLGPYKNTSWMVFIPKQSNSEQYKGLSTFQDQLDNLFIPLFQATLDPLNPRYRDLSNFLEKVGTFFVGSEDLASASSTKYDRVKVPRSYAWKKNRPDIIFHYFVWANLVSLNALRSRLGMNTFHFRVMCLEAAPVDDTIVSSFLLADTITHGLRMFQNAVLGYLYALTQIGVIMSPLSNNAVHIPYENSPFPPFLRRGLRVSLATNDPLYYHVNEDPLIEEMGTASKIYKLSGLDMAELARNSVLNSAFPTATKQKYLGSEYDKGSAGNNFDKTNVPRIRILFREESLRAEYDVLAAALKSMQKPIKPPPFEIPRVLPIPDWLSNITIPAASIKDLSTLNTSSQTYERRVIDDKVPFPRMHIVGPDEIEEANQRSARKLLAVIRKRTKYVWTPPRHWEIEDSRHSIASSGSTGSGHGVAALKDEEWSYEPLDGVIIKKKKHEMFQWPEGLPKLTEFEKDLEEIDLCRESVSVKALAYRRLHLLEHKFNLHLAMNSATESGINVRKRVETDRDFYKTPKVDTHIHMDGGFTARQLLNFILYKAQLCSEDIVYENQRGDPITLGDLLKSLDLKAETLTVDKLNVQADTTRVDSFIEKYNPVEPVGSLRSVLLSTDNYMGGRYFAELIKLTFEQYKQDEFTFTENRLTIYGKSPKEWHSLAGWFDTHGMASQQNKWLVQFPRLYRVLRTQSPPLVTSFAKMLQNIFEPLWEVSLNPAKNPKLDQFLKHVSGFDSVDNESKVDRPMRSDPNEPPTSPNAWTDATDPPYNYWMYYLWANIRTLNQFRHSRGLSTFKFRPQCGECGSLSHLAGCFLVADGINHGINLRKDPVLEYLYYLSQIGVAVSPLSNNGVHLDYLANPFPSMYKRGLNVSLSTDDPLQFHHTQEPLIEEYSIASKIWKLSPNDMCEIARNSVLQSGFSHEWKCKMIGPLHFLNSSRSNSVLNTHLSDIRVAFRYEVYHAEIDTLQRYNGPGTKIDRAFFTLEEEERIIEIIRKRQIKELPSLESKDQVANKKLQEMSSALAMVQAKKEELEVTVSRLQKELLEARAKADVFNRRLSNGANSVQSGVQASNAGGGRAMRQGVSFVQDNDGASAGPPNTAANNRKWRVFSTGSELSTAMSSEEEEEELDMANTSLLPGESPTQSHKQSLATTITTVN